MTDLENKKAVLFPLRNHMSGKYFSNQYHGYSCSMDCCSIVLEQYLITINSIMMKFVGRKFLNTFLPRNQTILTTCSPISKKSKPKMLNLTTPKKKSMSLHCTHRRVYCSLYCQCYWSITLQKLSGSCCQEFITQWQTYLADSNSEKQMSKTCVLFKKMSGLTKYSVVIINYITKINI